jgi:hypothetical protein
LAPESNRSIPGSLSRIYPEALPGKVLTERSDQGAPILHLFAGLLLLRFSAFLHKI